MPFNCTVKHQGYKIYSPPFHVLEIAQYWCDQKLEHLADGSRIAEIYDDGHLVARRQLPDPWQLAKPRKNRRR